jgi:2'-5' RNA ligase
MFLGAAPDGPARTALDQIMDGLRSQWAHAAQSLRWTPAENVHVTLHFLGEIDDAAAGRLLVALDDPLPEPPIAVTIGDLGVFPPHGPPRVIWLSVIEGRAALERAHRLLAERLHRAQLPVEPRPWAAHATIAKCREPRRSRERLHLDWSKFSTARVSWQLDFVSLFTSDLSGPVPRYSVLQRVRLATRQFRVPE